jgi:hypothetical protein
MKDFHPVCAAAPGRPGRRKALAAAVLGLALWQLPLAQAAGPKLPEGLKAPEKAAPMPAFELPTTAGAQLDSGSLAGQVVVIRFWASW